MMTNDWLLSSDQSCVEQNAEGVSSSAVGVNSMRMLSCWVSRVARGPGTDCSAAFTGLTEAHTTIFDHHHNSSCSDEVLRVLPRTMELIEVCCPSSCSAFSVAMMKALQSIVSSGPPLLLIMKSALPYHQTFGAVKKDFEPYLEPACTLIRRHLEAALQSPSEDAIVDDALTRYEQAGLKNGLELVMAMMNNKLDALCRINPSLLMDWIEAADWVHTLSLFSMHFTVVVLTSLIGLKAGDQ